jgi:hypothetical protein
LRPAHSGCAFTNRSVDAGYRVRKLAGRIGLRNSSPPQLGQMPLKTASAQSLQNVHSNEQQRASVLSAGRSTSQHSQFGFNNNIGLSHDRSGMDTLAPFWHK